MRVTIDHSEFKEGLIFKTRYHAVDVKVEFNEEEKAIVKKNQMADLVLLERTNEAHRGPKDEHYSVEVQLKAFMKRKPDRHVVKDPLEAREYDAIVREVLGNLKEHLVAGGEPLESSTFEL